ncbi:hypothetical protein PN36_28275 [Candidatus Thiomargarita nelsonii]|uniref:Uncharacterized protein n=1 Tax=Candidatus Thiomargarita nelsonii TaxID=1003181 RepID=A0A0A6P5T0_9GAMM|nr:hypothetical protein PN36_28275 [Candidatus Thiomargarita nelsonii]
MKKQFVVLSTFLLLASGCNPSSVVSSVDDAIEKDAILDSFDSKPDIKEQTIKTVDERIEKPDELLSTVEPEDRERENSTVPLGDDAIEHHPLLQD